MRPMCFPQSHYECTWMYIAVLRQLYKSGPSIRDHSHRGSLFPAPGMCCPLFLRNLCVINIHLPVGKSFAGNT